MNKRNVPSTWYVWITFFHTLLTIDLTYIYFGWRDDCSISNNYNKWVVSYLSHGFVMQNEIKFNLYWCDVEIVPQDMCFVLIGYTCYTSIGLDGVRQDCTIFIALYCNDAYDDDLHLLCTNDLVPPPPLWIGS